MACGCENEDVKCGGDCNCNDDCTCKDPKGIKVSDLTSIINIKDTDLILVADVEEHKSFSISFADLCLSIPIEKSLSIIAPNVDEEILVFIATNDMTVRYITTICTDNETKFVLKSNDTIIGSELISRDEVIVASPNDDIIINRGDVVSIHITDSSTIGSMNINIAFKNIIM